jgi:hypothetical protein
MASSPEKLDRLPDQLLQYARLPRQKDFGPRYGLAFGELQRALRRKQKTFSTSATPADTEPQYDIRYRGFPSKKTTSLPPNGFPPK